MNFLADESVDRQIVERLRQEKHIVLYVAEIERGISDEDVPFVEETVKNTGKQVKDLLGLKWFQSELKERKEVRDTKEAIPTSTPRAGTSTRDQEDYWIAKGELPPADQIELRRKVVMKKAQIDLRRSKFTDQPVV